MDFLEQTIASWRCPADEPSEVWHGANAKDPWDVWENNRFDEALPACERRERDRAIFLRRWWKVLERRTLQSTYCHKSLRNVRRTLKQRRETATSRTAEHLVGCSSCRRQYEKCFGRDPDELSFWWNGSKGAFATDE